MWVGIVTIFPGIFSVISNYGIISKSLKSGNIKLCFFNPRCFVENFLIDAKPYSDTPGILLNVEILKNVINYAKFESKNINTKVIFLSPKGNVISQSFLVDILSYSSIIFVSGKYEGIDERFIEFFVDYEISIGDFVLSSGEFVIMFLIEALVRLCPKVLSNSLSIFNDSFVEYVFDTPHYTKPRSIYNLIVPNILILGNFFNLEIWKLKVKLGCTFFKRRDLFNNFRILKIHYVLLRNFILKNRKKRILR